MLLYLTFIVICYLILAGILTRAIYYLAIFFYGNNLMFSALVYSYKESFSLNPTSVKQFYPEISIDFKKYWDVPVYYLQEHFSFAGAFPVKQFIIIGPEPKLALPHLNPYAAISKETMERFIFFHELNHLTTANKCLLFKFLYLYRGGRIISNEIECDNLAAIFIGKYNVVYCLELLIKDDLENYGTRCDPVKFRECIDELNIRIMALYMPTLFTHYAS